MESNISGFSDPNATSITIKIKKENKDLFKIIRSLEEIYFDISKHFIKDTNYPGLYLITILIEIFNSAQSVVILLEKGAKNDASNVLRSIYEKTFILKAIINNNENYDLVEKQAEFNKITFKKLVEEHQVFKELGVEPQVSGVKSQENIKKEKYAKSTTIKKWSILADMLDTYLIESRYFCGFTHYDLARAKEKIVKVDDGIIINNIIDYNGIRFVLYNLVNILISSYLFYSEWDNQVRIAMELQQLHNLLEKMVNSE